MYSKSYMAWELVTETLIRVPIKSAIRFRSLSKSCNALITSAEFIHSHYNQTRSRKDDESNLILLNLRSVDSKEPSYTLRVDNEAFEEYRTLNPPRGQRQFDNLKVLASCNGLVCLIDEDTHPNVRRIVLWNPCINKCVELPFTSSMFLECVSLGFGFDSDTKDFKVCRVFQEENRRVAEAYSLRKRSWKAVDVSGDFVDPSRSYLYRLPRRFIQCIYNNVVHHLAGYDIIRRDRGFKRFKIMFKFDPRNDSVDMVEVPLLGGELVDIFASNCCLAVLERSLRSFGHRYRVWVLEEYGDMSSWKNKFVFDTEEWISNILGSRRSGEILMWDRNKGLVSYDPETCRITNLQGAAAIHCIRAVTHVENLVLVDERSGIGQLSSPTSSNKRKER